MRGPVAGDGEAAFAGALRRILHDRNFRHAAARGDVEPAAA